MLYEFILELSGISDKQGWKCQFHTEYNCFPNSFSAVLLVLILIYSRYKSNVVKLHISVYTVTKNFSLRFIKYSQYREMFQICVVEVTDM
jgi:hypothetical protein